ncbi:MAG: heavy metal-responsive transcriptional regulator [Gemmatimonadales bacterium]
MTAKPLLIGDVAAQTGVSVHTLRFYERERMLTRPERDRSGYRRYDEEAIRVVRFIKRAQELGFSLPEIRELLRLRAPRAGRTTVRPIAERKLREVEQKLAHLKSLRLALGELVEACQCRGAELSCPILESLEGSTQ